MYGWYFNMKINMILAVFVYALASFSHAHNGNNGWVTLSTFTLWSNTYEADTIRVSAPDYYNPAGAVCNNPDSYMVSSTISEQARQRIYSTLLAAKMANKPVNVSLATNTCQEGRPKIINVTID